MNEASMGGGALLALEMGCGKTKVAIDLIANDLEVRHVLITCPLSVVPVWPAEFEKHSARTNVRVLALGNKLSVKKRTEKAEQFIAVNDAQHFASVIVINHESLWREPFGKWALKRKWDMLIVDECHKAKSPSGRFSRYLAKLRDNCTFRLGLTGTPMPHSPLDLFAQCRFLDPGVFGPHYTPFKAKYAVLGGFEGRQVVGFKNLDDLEERFDSITYRVKSADVLDLPETQHVVRWCSLSKKERAIYNEMKTDLITAIDNGVVTASNALVKLLRLQQIVQGSVTDENDVVHEVGNTKEMLLGEVLSEIDKDEPVVVFCLYLSDIDRVKRQAEEVGRSCAVLKGGTNELEKWQKGGANVLAVQIQSGGTGIDLTRARYCIFMCGTYNYGNYEQALARLHRPGQTRPVVYVHLMAKDTIDEIVEDAQRQKANIINNVMAGLKS